MSTAIDPAETGVGLKRTSDLAWIEICRSKMRYAHMQLRDMSLENAVWTDAECAELVRLSHLADDLATGLAGFGR